MSERTCGDLGGKPCEWLGTMTCPASDETPWVCQTCPACAPMLSLVEAREEVEKWKTERDKEWSAHQLDVRLLFSAQKDFKKWKRAAERLARDNDEDDPRHDEWFSACAPMLALVEERAEVARGLLISDLTAARAMIIAQANECSEVIWDLRYDRDHWKRAAEWLASRIDDCPVDISTDEDCAAYWLRRAVEESDVP